MTAERFDSRRDLALGSILASPFLLVSLGFHAVVFYALAHLAWSIQAGKPDLTIPVSLIEFGAGASDKSIGPARGPGGPRTLPRLGTPVAPRQAQARPTAPAAQSAPEEVMAGSSPTPEPALPAPKAIADAPARAPRIDASEASADSLVQLPTKSAAPHLPASVAGALKQPGSVAAKESTGGGGAYALKEGAEIPGALKGSGSGSGPYGVAGGIRGGAGTAGGGTGTGAGGGSASGIKGKPNADYGAYLKTIEKRVYAVWKYPEDASGVHKVSVRFTVDRAGKLTQAEVLESTDPKINASALEAMKKASPFPPIPESLKDLAGEPLIIRFTIAVRMRG
ncbi:MAG TPA: TonB family protein [Candidatus Acidoferrales bacterium]|nr:TonB family protein [Candidatus Acidoferrales bacterium]